MTELHATAVTTLNNRSAVGTHTGSITVNYTDSHGNYEVTTVAGDYEVTKAALPANVNNYIGTYDGLTHGISVVPHALFTDEHPTVYYGTSALNESNYLSAGSLTSPEFRDVVNNGGNVGNYTVYYYVVMDNYEGLSGTGTVTINKRAVTFTSGNATKVYDGTALVKNSTDPAAPDYTHTPLVTGDSVSSISITGSQTRAGTGANTISAAHISDSNGTDITGNYDITYVAGNLTVTKRPITVTAGSATKMYDGTPLTTSDASVTAGSLVSGDTITAAMTAESTVTNVRYAGNSVTAAQNVIDHVTVTDAGGVDVTDCYEISKLNGGLTVTKKPLSIRAKSFTRQYDGTAFTKAGTYSSATIDEAVLSTNGLVAGDELSDVTLAGSITYYGTTGNTDNVISNAVVKRAGTDVTGNYEITYIPGTLSITKRPITVTAGSAVGADAFTYDGTFRTKADGYSVTTGSLASGDSLRAVMTADSGQKDVGIGANTIDAVTITNASGANITSSYDVSTMSGSIEVKPRSITIAPDNATGRYGDTPSHLTWHVVSGSIAVPGEISATVSSTTDENTVVGTYADALSVTATNPNYMISTGTADYTVSKRNITIVADSKQEVFTEGSTLTCDTWHLATGDSFAPNDTLDSILITGSLDALGEADNVPSDAVIMRSSVDVTSNYEITYANGILSFVDRIIIIIGNSSQGDSGSGDDSGDDDNDNPTWRTPDSGANPENGSAPETVRTAQDSIRENNKPENAGVSKPDSEGAHEEPDNKGNLVGSADIIDATGERTVEVIGTRNKDVGCSVTEADTERMSKELLTKEELDSFAAGEDLIFRVEVNETEDTEKSHLAEVSEALKDSDVIGTFRSVFYVKVGDAEERKVNENYSYVGVSVKLPEEMLEALRNGGSILQVYIDENGVPLAKFIDFTIIEDGQVALNVDNFSTYMVVSRFAACYIHWLILLMLMLSVAIALIYFCALYRKEERNEDGLEDKKPAGRKGFNLQLAAVIALNLTGAILGFAFGECKWDIYAAWAMLIISAGVEGGGKYITRKKE